YWMYDARLGRRWNVDPKFKKYPFYTSYHAFNNNPIYYNDPSGAEPPYGDGACSDCIKTDNNGSKTITAPNGKEYTVGKATNILSSTGESDSEGFKYAKGVWAYTDAKGEQYLWD